MRHVGPIKAFSKIFFDVEMGEFDMALGPAQNSLSSCLNFAWGDAEI